MNTIPYAISYIEWSEEIENIPRSQAGKLLKALMTATFEEADTLTLSIKEEQIALTEAFTAGTITLEEWTARMRELSEISCRWIRMRAATEKSVASYKKRSEANSENGKKKGKAKREQEQAAQAETQTATAPRAIFNI